MSDSEAAGKDLASRVSRHIEANNGQYLRDEAGLLHVVLCGKRIPLNLDRENQALAELMINACDVTLLSQGAQAAIQRLQVMVRRQAQTLCMRNFSAVSDDQLRLFIPIAAGNLLLVTAEDVQEVANGDNEYHLWVEHPNGEPFRYTARSGGLEGFERLLVETQACTSPAMRWLVAMHLGLFPYVRDLCPARFIMEMIGQHQSGKTSGAARFTHLHGLGNVKGDFSVAALNNMGDIGLLVMDNKEQQNFIPEFIDYLLFLATGAERGRSYSDGKLRPRQNGRPVGVITTIEGAVKAELQARCVEVPYGVPGPRLPRDSIEREISSLRHKILSAIIPVFSCFLKIRNDPVETPNPLPNFQEHFTALCKLLRAYGIASGRPASWSEGIIAEWNRLILATEADEDDLDHPLSRIFRDYSGSFIRSGLTFNNRPGTLWVITAGELLTLLQKLNLRDLSLPRTTNGLAKRLKSSSFQSFTYLQTGTPGVAELVRKAGRRPMGFFRPDDMSVEEAIESKQRHRLNLAL